MSVTHDAEVRADARPSPPTPPGRDRLSRREAEVANLVAEGLTNREVAAELYISPRTVESHVEHIKRKLGLTSRYQIVVWVLRNGTGTPDRASSR